MSIYDTGILMTSGFSIASGKPADLKYLADSIEDRDNYVLNNLAYEGMLVYVKENEKTYQYMKTGWEEFGFNLDKFANNVYDDLNSDSTTLALSAKQGKVLNSKITSHISSSSIHITEDERTKWNNKVDPNNLSTQTMNGLMSSSDKKKLDGIDENANNYTHPETHSALIIDQDETHRFVTDNQISIWNSKLESIPVATQGVNGLMSAEDKLKLDSIDTVSGSYVHPETHDASIINQDATHRFVSDIQIASWDELIEKVAAIEEKLTTAVFYKEGI